MHDAQVKTGRNTPKRWTQAAKLVPVGVVERWEFTDQRFLPLHSGRYIVSEYQGFLDDVA